MTAPAPDDRPLMTVWPSVASTAVGRALGWLYESIPLRVGTPKLSHLLFPLPTAPIGLAVYFWLKAAGPRYLLSTRRLRIERGLARRPGPEVPLDEVGRVDVIETRGHRFFHAGDLVVRDHVGMERLRLRGVVRPDGFRRTILEARDAVVRTEAAKRHIEARHAAKAS